MRACLWHCAFYSDRLKTLRNNNQMIWSSNQTNASKLSVSLYLLKCCSSAWPENHIRELSDYSYLTFHLSTNSLY